ncbi:MAG: FeoB-associated Cys-rich membrane protein [Clostridiaceae bacterium]|nr:FeoB-associated Cys-rich membrane protein [Clostridiaceae bacterium]
MIEFLKNNLSTIIISGILLAIVVAVIIKKVRDSRAGKGSCGCSCSSCGAASICHSKK